MHNDKQVLQIICRYDGYHTLLEQIQLLTDSG